MVGAATVLHRRGGRAAVAVLVGVAVGVPDQQSRGPSSRRPSLPQLARNGSLSLLAQVCGGCAACMRQ